MPSNTRSRSHSQASTTVYKNAPPQPALRYPTASKPRYRSSGRRRKKVRSHAISYILLILFCLAATIILSYSVFFKVESIKVVGNETYSSKEIIDLVGVNSGDSLFQINTSSGESKLKTKLPFVREAHLVRRLPSTLQIQIVEEELLGAIYTNQGYTIISTTGKILKNGVLSIPENAPCIFGLEDQIFEIGEYAKESGPDIKPKDANLLPKVVLLQDFYSQIKSLDFSGIDYIDISDKYNLKVFYDKRILISFGTPIQVKEKIELMTLVLDEQEDFEGTIDLSWVGEAHTLPTDAEKIMDARAYTQFGMLEDSTLPGDNTVPPDNTPSGENTSQEDNTLPGDDKLPEEIPDDIVSENPSSAESPEKIQDETSSSESQGTIYNSQQTQSSTGNEELSSVAEMQSSEEQVSQEDEAAVSDEVATAGYTITLG